MEDVLAISYGSLIILGLAVTGTALIIRPVILVRVVGVGTGMGSGSAREVVVVSGRSVLHFRVPAPPLIWCELWHTYLLSYLANHLLSRSPTRLSIHQLTI